MSEICCVDEQQKPTTQEVQNGKFDSSEKRTPSELDLRAASMRARIEQKLDEIEAQMKLQHEVFAEHDYFEPDPTKFLDVIENMQLMDVKRSRSCSLAEMKETAITRLTAELDNAQKELKLKDEEVAKLSKVRDEVGAEIEDLTASLFEEANNMVNEANMKRSVAEKHAKEANMKLNVLQEEVTALKTLIQATMPFIPNYESQPSDQSPTTKRLTLGKKSPSCSSLQNKSVTAEAPLVSPLPAREHYEPDPVLHSEFVKWRQNPIIDKSHCFLKRVYKEDIDQCMDFQNKELAEKVLLAIEEERITVENISDKTPLPKMCALLQAPRFCHYRMNIGTDEDFYISTLSRNRVAAICDFFCYLRYIERGLITHSIHEVYLEILKKRKAIFMARLGLLETTSV